MLEPVRVLVCVELTSVSGFLHVEESPFQPLAVDALRVSEGDATVQTWVLVSQNLTAKVRRHGVV